MARRVAAYPWHALERLDRTAVRALSAVRRRLETAPTLDGLARTLSDILGAETELVIRRTSAASRAPRGLLLPLELAGARARLTLGLEPPLASRVLAPLLGRPVTLDRLDATADTALLGALAAVAVEAVRRAGGLPGLVPAWDNAPRFEPRCAALVETSLLLDGRGYAVDVLVELDSPATTFAPVRVKELGVLPIELAVVAALSSTNALDLARLEPGAAWMPGEGWWIDASGAGRAALASPLGERGVAVDLARDGRIVLRGDPVELPVEVEPSENRMSDNVTTEQVLSEAVLEAPVVVRVELGAVSMTAREWAELRPGDVIESGKRTGEHVVLRVSGREVARGELVDIEGELGIRIRELVSEETA